MSSSVPYPPGDGSMTLLPGFLDYQAEHNAHSPWAVFPARESTRPGRRGSEREVVILLIHTDTILYVSLLAGLIRAGIVAFPISPRNSAPAVCSMLEKTGCHRILSQPSLDHLIHQVKEELDMQNYALQVDELPALYDIFPSLSASADSSPPEPYPAAPAHHPDDLVMYIHSSGSTGFPKPIPFTQRLMIQWVNSNAMTGARDRHVIYSAMALPVFHVMGFTAQLVYPIMSGNPVGLFAPLWPAQPVVAYPHNTITTSRLCGCTGLTTVPSFLEAWVHDDEAVEYLKTLKILVFGGGPLASKTGDTLVKAGVKLVIAYGGTEFGGPTQAYPEDADPDAPVQCDEDWAWMRFSKRAKIRWVPEGDGTYELQLLTTDSYIVAVENLPDVKGYATSDLFVPHPTREGLWKIVGRKDDVIVLSTGEKIVPLNQEDYVNANPIVNGALMFGREREQAGMIIEPHPEYAVDPSDEVALAELRNRVWPAVEQANLPAPAFARVFKEMILVTHPDKPLPRAGKGTIIRKQAIALYEKEIDALYQAVEESSDTRGVAPPDSWDPDTVEDWLTEVATSVTDGETPLATVSLFDQGFDSLSATFMRNRIVGSLRSSGDPELTKAAGAVSQNFVFEYPSIRELASAVAALVGPTSQLMDPQQKRAQEIIELVNKYTADLPEVRGRRANAGNQKIVALLTGSTGNIGSHILASLLSDKRITRVYTLNRPSTSTDDRLLTAFEDRSLPTKLLSQSKLISLTGDISQENFGIAPGIYEEITECVTHIIHNAWTVNFNHSLSTFEPQIAAVRKVIDTLASLDRPVHLLFTSSVGTASGWDPSRGPVPERPLDDPEYGAHTGYAASKYVVEQIFAKASSTGVGLTALRMGQACGAKSTGAWGTTEWVPIMVKSSIALGCLPRMNGPVSWIPLDAIGSMYLDLLTSDETLPSVINVVHPRPTTWKEMLHGIWEELGASLPFVTLEEWVKRLDALPTAVSNEELQKIPALKLRAFFRGMARADKQQNREGYVNLEIREGTGVPLFETSELQRCSPAMRQLKAMDKYHARMWVKYWKSKGYI